MTGNPTIRPAVAADAFALSEVFRRGDPAEFTARLNEQRGSSTEFYVVELSGELVGAFALTPLGALTPGSMPRLLLHEIKLKRRFRGQGVPEWVFGWLAETLGTGQNVDLVLLGPTENEPPLISDLGMVKVNHAFLWAAERAAGATADGGVR